MTVDQDRAAIREVIENWALWRDAGDWDRFATVWHEDGWMTATWFQGPATRFIEVSREGFDRGVSIPEGLVVGEDPEEDARRFRRSEGGVCLVTQPMIDRLSA